MISVLIAAVAAWIASMAPLLLQASLKRTAGTWIAVFLGALLWPDSRRARRLVWVYVALVCFPVVDYLVAPSLDFVGGAPGGLAYFPSDALLVAAGVILAYEQSIRLPPRPMRMLLALGFVYLLAQIPAVLGSPAPLESGQQWYLTARGMAAAIVVGAIAASGGRTLVNFLLAGAVIQALVAGAQQAVRQPLGLSWLGEAPADQLFKYISPGVGLWRSGGTLGHPNVMASYVIGVLPVAAAVAVGRGTKSRRLLGSVALIGSACALLVTYSRAAWAVALLSLVLMAVCGVGPQLLRMWRGRVLAAMLVAVAIAAWPMLRHRLVHTESSATDVRIALAAVAREMASSYPVSGVGLNRFHVRVPEFDPEMRLELFRHPVHNIVLLDLAESGYPGGVASIALWGGGLVLILMCARVSARQHRWEAVGLWIGCGALVLHNAVDWTLRRPAIALLYWILAALAAAEQHGQGEEMHPERGHAAPLR